MKKNILFVRIGLLLVLVTVLASCSEQKQAVVIPKDAIVVGSVNLNSLVKKSDIVSHRDDAELKRLITQAGKDLNAEGKKLLDKLVADPSASGIDFGQKIYYFLEPYHGDMCGGLAFRVKSTDDLTALFKTFAADMGTGEATKKDGFYTLEGVHNGAVVFNNDVLLVLAGDDDMSAYAAQLIKQERSASFAADRSFNKLADADDDMAAVLNFAAIPTELLGNASNIKASLPQGCELKDLALLTKLNFETGRIVLEGEPLLYSDAWKREIKEAKKVTNSIKGKYFDYVPADATLAIFSNTDGKKAVERIKKNQEQTAKSAKIQGMNVSKMFDLASSLMGSIDGESTFYMRSGGMGREMNFSAYIQTSSSVLADSLKRMLPEMQTGTKDGYTYVLTDKMASAGQKEAIPLTVSPAAKEIKGSLFALYMNIGSATEQLPYGRSGFDLGARFIASAFSYMLFTTDGDEGKLSFVLKDENENALKYFVDQAFSLAKKM